MRLIDADKLKEKLEARHDNGDDEFDKGYNLGIEAAIDLLDSAPYYDKIPAGKCADFVKFVAKWIVDDNFQEDADIFAELACRKLVKLGLVEIDEDTYKLKEE